MSSNEMTTCHTWDHLLSFNKGGVASVPTERFYRLPGEKKTTIVNALRHEFARVPFDKASINQMIRNADISRGSFYTYFTDKEDAARYVMEEGSRELQTVCEDALKASDGDYLDMLKALFQYLSEEISDQTEMMNVVKNLSVVCSEDNLWSEGAWNSEYRYLQNLPQEASYRCFGNSESRLTRDGPLKWLMDRMDKRRLRIRTEKEYFFYIMIGAWVLAHSIRQFYKYPERKSWIRSNFEIEMDLLRNGAYLLQ
jgi:AcrR family transcriptional regulator